MEQMFCGAQIQLWQSWKSAGLLESVRRLIGWRRSQKEKWRSRSQREMKELETEPEPSLPEPEPPLPEPDEEVREQEFQLMMEKLNSTLSRALERGQRRRRRR
jgi:hypothetical protein